MKIEPKLQNKKKSRPHIRMNKTSKKHKELYGIPCQRVCEANHEMYNQMKNLAWGGGQGMNHDEHKMNNHEEITNNQWTGRWTFDERLAWRGGQGMNR